MKQDTQLVGCYLAISEKYWKLPVQAGNFYVNPELSKMKLIDVVEEEVDAVIVKVKEAVAGILSEDFEVVEQPECRFCDCGEIC